MKKIIVFSLLLIAGFNSIAQKDTLQPYEKNKNLPEFSLLNVDSVVFTSKILVTDKKIILMLFNPDCDHCQKQLDDLLSIDEVTRNAELVLISVVPLKFNREFYKKNKLEKYVYIHLGQDYKGFCIPFYNPHTVPVLVFYDKKKQFVSIHQGNTEKQVIIDALKD